MYVSCMYVCIMCMYVCMYPPSPHLYIFARQEFGETKYFEKTEATEIWNIMPV